MRDVIPMPDVPVGTVPNGAGSQFAAIGAFIATAAGWLPFILALLPAVYYLILIYESKTVQGWVERRRARRAARKLANAQAAVIVAAAQGEAKAVVAEAAVVVAKDELKSIPPKAS